MGSGAIYRDKRRMIKPDPNSWLVPDFISVCKNFRNEFGLTLWDALHEYVSFHNSFCVFQDREYEGELFLYPILDYNHQNRRATLKRLFFVSKPVKTIFMHDYLNSGSDSKNNTPFMNLLKNPEKEKHEDFPELEFMVCRNNMEPSLAKELLLKNSFYRRSIKKAFVLNNESEGIDYNSTNIISIDFDLSFLDKCSFLDAKRYSGFRDLLPPNLIMTVGCRLEFELPDIPKSLKKQQILDVDSVSR